MIFDIVNSPRIFTVTREKSFVETMNKNVVPIFHAFLSLDFLSHRLNNYFDIKRGSNRNLLPNSIHPNPWCH